MPVLFGLLLVSALLMYWVDTPNELIDTFFGLMVFCFVVFPLAVMFWQGTFRKAWWGWIGCFAFAGIIVGALFKIMHWPGGAILSLSSSVTFAALYLLHFITKSSKGSLDWMKLICLVSCFALTLAFSWRLLPRDLFWMGQFSIIMMLYVTFYMETLKYKAVKPAAVGTEGSNIFRYEE